MITVGVVLFALVGLMIWYFWEEYNSEKDNKKVPYQSAVLEVNRIRSLDPNIIIEIDDLKKSLDIVARGDRRGKVVKLRQQIVALARSASNIRVELESLRNNDILLNSKMNLEQIQNCSRICSDILVRYQIIDGNLENLSQKVAEITQEKIEGERSHIQALPANEKS